MPSQFTKILLPGYRPNQSNVEVGNDLLETAITYNEIGMFLIQTFPGNTAAHEVALMLADRAEHTGQMARTLIGDQSLVTPAEPT